MSGKNKHKNQQTPTADNTSQKENTNRHVYIEPGAKIDFVQDLRDKYDAAQKDSTSHSKDVLFWTKVSAVLLFIYAGLTFWQGYSSQKAANAAKSAAQTADQSLKDSRQTFRLENRPYVVIAPPGIPSFVKSKDGKVNLDAVNVRYTDIGKTPAGDVFVLSRFRTWRYQGSGQPPPKIPFIDEEFMRINEDEAKIAQNYAGIPKSDIGPNATPAFLTNELEGEDVLSPTDKLNLLKPKNNISIILLSYVGRIHYRGFSGTESYTTEFCFFFFGEDTNIWHYCPSHNIVR